MPTATAYSKTLDELAALLRRKPLTARAIADGLGCCVPVAYRRVQALRDRGDAVYELPVSTGRPGPRAVAFGVR